MAGPCDRNPRAPVEGVEGDVIASTGTDLSIFGGTDRDQGKGRIVNVERALSSGDKVGGESKNW